MEAARVHDENAASTAEKAAPAAATNDGKEGQWSPIAGQKIEEQKEEKK